MKTEEVLFEVFNEIVMLSELYENLSSEQVGSIIESVTASFTDLPPDVIIRYKSYLKNSIRRENARGAIERATVLEEIAETFE